MFYIKFADQTKTQAFSTSAAYDTYSQAESAADSLLEFEPRGMS